MFRKILSLSLALIASILIFSSCNLKDNKDYHTSVDASDVALLSLYTFDGKAESKMGLFNLGHSFLSIENISDEDIKVGKVTLAPDKAVTIGAWSIKAHFGVWYNVESLYIKDYNKYDGRVSITAGINKDDLEVMSQFIDNHDIWTPFRNCSNFALNLWNTVASDTEELVKPVIYSPSKIKKELSKFNSFETNRHISTDDQMFYFDGDTPKYFKLKV